MHGFGTTTFGELNAADYDTLHNPDTTKLSVDAIAQIAGDGAQILELAIGSGRMALPLAEMGFEISGIEGSTEMVDLLRKKSGGNDIPIVIGDYADVAIEGPFDHVFLVYNTLFNLPSQEAQLRCFKNVADRLNKNGTFLIETFVPDFSDFENGQRMRTMKIDMHSAWIEAATHDPVNQMFEFQRIRITPEGVKLVPLPMRYAWPSEIDLMAKLAGLQLKSRWGDWQGSPFTNQSKMHVTVYEK